jgi:hypothetical protein
MELPIGINLGVECFQCTYYFSFDHSSAKYKLSPNSNILKGSITLVLVGRLDIWYQTKGRQLPALCLH